MMLSEMQFENNQDGGDVQILFDKTAHRKKPFDKRKFLWLFGAVGIVLLVCGNIWAGWGTWGSKSKHSFMPSPTPAINSNNFNSSLNVKIKDFIFDFHWHIDFDSEAIQFSVTSKNSTFADNRWLLIGFSNTGEIVKSDYCVFKNKNLTDGYVDISKSLITDIQQDCELISSDQNGFSFKRKWSTCDPRDIVLSKGTTNLFFASDVTEASNINEVSSHKAKLFSPDIPPTQLESDIITLSITASNLTITNNKQWCLIKKLSEDLRTKKNHLVRIEPLITVGNEKVIQQMELYYCSYDGKDSLEYNGTCQSEKPKNCAKSIFVWSLGASPFDFPKEAGFPIGGSDISGGYIMLKIEYANQNPINDSSGFNLYYTSTLRSNDAGILELGISSTTANAIPPKQKSFALNGFCLPECSAKFPDNGITVFGSRLHTHSLGKLVRTSIYRSGRRIGNLNFDQDFVYNWHIVDSLEPQITVEKNDMLMTTCVYDSENRENVTFGGDEPTDEMCSNIIYYYPAMEISVCKSAIEDNALQTWFAKKGNSDASKTVKQKYESLSPWNASLIDDLIELYFTSPLKAECLNQSGVLINDGMTNLKKPFISKISEESRITYECPSIDDL